MFNKQAVTEAMAESLVEAFFASRLGRFVLAGGLVLVGVGCCLMAALLPY